MEASVQVRKTLASPSAAPVDCVSHSWSSDGRFLAAAYDKRAVVYNARADFEQVTAFDLRYSAASIALAQYQHDGSEGEQHRHFLILGSSFGAELYQVDLPSSGATSEQHLQIKAPVASVYADVAIGLVQASSDGRFAAFGSVDGRLFVRDLTSLNGDEPETLTGFGKEVLRKLLPSPRVTGLAFSPSGTALLAATRKGNVFVFEYQASAHAWQWYKPTRHLAENPKSGGVSGANAAGSAAASTQTLAVWWTPSVFAVCSRSAPSRIELFDLKSGKLLHSLVFSAAKRQDGGDTSADNADKSSESSRAFNEWIEEPQVTGLCVSSGPRRLLCHDTSCNLFVVDWPFLELLSTSQSSETITER